MILLINDIWTCDIIDAYLTLMNGGNRYAERV